MSFATRLPVFWWPYSLPFNMVLDGGNELEDFGTGRYGTRSRYTRPRRGYKMPIIPGDWRKVHRQLNFFYRNRRGAMRPFLFPVGKVLESVGDNEYRWGAEGEPIFVAHGDGATQAFALPDKFVDPRSVQIYVDGVAAQASQLLSGAAYTLSSLDGSGEWQTEGTNTKQAASTQLWSPEPMSLDAAALETWSVNNGTATADISEIHLSTTIAAGGVGYYQLLMDVFVPALYAGAAGANKTEFRLLAETPQATSPTASIYPSDDDEDLADQWTTVPHAFECTTTGTLKVSAQLRKGYAAAGRKRMAYVGRPSLRQQDWYFTTNKLNDETNGTEITFESGSTPTSGAVITASYVKLDKVRMIPGQADFSLPGGYLVDPGLYQFIEDPF